MVTELKKTKAFEIEVVSKTKEEKEGDSTLPLFPAGEIDGELFFEDRILTREELENKLHD